MLSLSCAISSWFTRFYRFLVAFMSVNVLVFDLLIKKYETFLSVNSWCLLDLLQVDLVLIPSEKASSPAKELHRGRSATERATKSRGRLVSSEWI